MESVILQSVGQSDWVDAVVNESILSTQAESAEDGRSAAAACQVPDAHSRDARPSRSDHPVPLGPVFSRLSSFPSVSADVSASMHTASAASTEQLYRPTVQPSPFQDAAASPFGEADEADPEPPTKAVHGPALALPPGIPWESAGTPADPDVLSTAPIASSEAFFDAAEGLDGDGATGSVTTSVGAESAHDNVEGSLRASQQGSQEPDVDEVVSRFQLDLAQQHEHALDGLPCPDTAAGGPEPAQWSPMANALGAVDESEAPVELSNANSAGWVSWGPDASADATSTGASDEDDHGRAYSQNALGSDPAVDAGARRPEGPEHAHSLQLVGQDADAQQSKSWWADEDPSGPGPQAGLQLSTAAASEGTHSSEAQTPAIDIPQDITNVREVVCHVKNRRCSCTHHAYLPFQMYRL